MPTYAQRTEVGSDRSRMAAATTRAELERAQTATTRRVDARIDELAARRAARATGGAR